MATWNEVKGYLKSTYPVTKEEDYYVMFEFSTVEERAQLIMVSYVKSDVFGEWLQISSPIGAIPANRLDEALSMMGTFPIGGIAKFDNMYFLRDSMKFSEYTSDRLISEMSLILHAADYMEKIFLKVDKM